MISQHVQTFHEKTLFATKDIQLHFLTFTYIVYNK